MTLEVDNATKGGPLAVAVKRNDLLDNADPARRWAETPLSRYRWAWTYLFPNEPGLLGRLASSRVRGGEQSKGDER